MILSKGLTECPFGATHVSQAQQALIEEEEHSEASEHDPEEGQANANF